VQYGASSPKPTRSFEWSALGQLKVDELKNGAGTSMRRAAYSYDLDGNVSAEAVTPDALAGPDGTQTYSYDLADRLTSWVHDGATTDYAYDDNGNRTQAGTTTFTYDDRNRVTSDSTGVAYTWSARGTLDNAGGIPSAYDAFGRLTNSWGGTYTYDSLDRIATRGATTFAYEGANIDPIYDGTFRISHTPGGNALGHRSGATNRFALNDRHGDLAGLFDTSAALSTSVAYDPWGTENARTGTTNPNIGFQGDYTDPSNNLVWMGARFYSTTTAAFTSRDTYSGELSTPVSLNRYTYANNNPVLFFDPFGLMCASDDGHGCIIVPSTGKVNPANYTPFTPPDTRERARRQQQWGRQERNCSTHGESCPVNYEAVAAASARPATTPIAGQCAADAYVGAIGDDFNDCSNGAQSLEDLRNGHLADAYMSRRSTEIVNAVEEINATIKTALEAIASVDTLAFAKGIFTQPFVDCLSGRSSIATRTLGCGQIALNALPALRAATRALRATDDAADALQAMRGVEAATSALASGGAGATGAAADDLTAAAGRAAEAVGPGRGAVYGTRVHSAFASEIKALGRSDVFSEVSYLHGDVVPYGTPGSVRLDAIVGTPGAPTAIYDLKTGSAVLTPSRIDQIRAQLPQGFQDIPVLELRP
jgi:RHS repeat-associated protein